MSQTFKNNTTNSNFNDGNVNSTFGKVTQNTFASDYITNKKAKLLYSTNYNKKRFGLLNDQNNLLLFKRAQLIRDIDTCVFLPALDNTNLESGLYSNEDLSGVNIITNILADTSNNLVCPIYSGSLLDPIVISGSPFYYTYDIDKCGFLFGNNNCGIENYTHFKKYVKPAVLSKQSLVNCRINIEEANQIIADEVIRVSISDTTAVRVDIVRPIDASFTSIRGGRIMIDNSDIDLIKNYLGNIFQTPSATGAFGYGSLQSTHIADAIGSLFDTSFNLLAILPTDVLSDTENLYNYLKNDPVQISYLHTIPIAQLNINLQALINAFCTSNKNNVNYFLNNNNVFFKNGVVPIAYIINRRSWSIITDKVSITSNYDSVSYNVYYLQYFLLTTGFNANSNQAIWDTIKQYGLFDFIGLLYEINNSIFNCLLYYIAAKSLKSV